MKIEMGESLFYSWLRHVKECQIVQTNWKVSPQWVMQHEEALAHLMEKADRRFSDKYGYKIFKQNASLSQIIQQGECDAIGACMQNDRNQIYAVDVAFHENGLNYGCREATVMKIIAKSIRTAMCLYGYMNCSDAEIIFASPKISPAILNDATPCIEELNNLLRSEKYDFHVRIIANDEFNSSVLQPILLISGNVADTSELFLRSYQMFTMFSENSLREEHMYAPKSTNQIIDKPDPKCTEANIYKELRIGQLAQVVFRRLLENGAASEEEISLMQTSDYSKQVLSLQFPALIRKGTVYDTKRYYAKPLIINGAEYYLCSQWFETPTNNDRPFLLRWIEQHSGTALSTENINKNNQRNNGRTQMQGTDHRQQFYEIKCLDCGHEYYANGSNVKERRCPNSQGGKP